MLGAPSPETAIIGVTAAYDGLQEKFLVVPSVTSVWYARHGKGIRS